MNYDERPIGQHKEIPSLTEYPTKFGEKPQVKPQIEEKSQALSEKLISKNWKVRIEAFAELEKQIAAASTKSSEIFTQHACQFEKYLADPHPGAQEKALDVFFIFLNKGVEFPFTHLNDLVVILVEKCITGKNSVKYKGIDAIIELSKNHSCPSIISTIVDLIESSKSPKIIVAALETLEKLLKQHGKDQFPIKEVLIAVEKQCVSSTNPAVRTAAMNIYQEAYCWLKDEILPFVENLKTSQQEELKKQFGKVQEIKQKEVKEENISRVQKEEAKESTALENTELFGQLWCSEILKLKKWSEKKSKLEELINVTAFKPLKLKCSNDLISTLKVLLNDTNIMVVNAALKVIGQLADSLKDEFVVYHKLLFRPLLQRFKDKKSVSEAEKCLEILSPYIKFEDIIDDVIEEIVDKSTTLRVHTCLWLEKNILPNISVNTIKFITCSGLMKSLIKLSDEAIVEVRVAALGCIGIIKAMIGEDCTIQKIIADFNQQKQDKVRLAAEVAKTKYGEKWSKFSSVKEVARIKENECPKEIHRKSVSPPRVRRPVTRQQTGNLPEIKKSPTRQQEIKLVQIKSDNEEESEPVISEEDAEKIIREKVGEIVSTEMEKPEWKQRQIALQKLNDWIMCNSENTKAIYEHIIIWLRIKLKDFKESNQAILKEVFAIINSIIKIQPVNKRFAGVAIPGLVEKMADPKWTDTCSDIIMTITKSASPSFVSIKIVKKLESSSKNLNVIKGGLSILGRIIQEHASSNTIPFAQIVECCKPFIAHPNQSIRATASSLLCIIYSLVGEPMKKLLGNLSENAMKALDLQLDQVKAKANPEAASKAKNIKENSPKKLLIAKEDLKNVYIPVKEITLISDLNEGPEESCKNSPSIALKIPVDKVVFNIKGEKEKRLELEKKNDSSVVDSQIDSMEKIKTHIQNSIHSSLFELMFSKTEKEQINAIKILTAVASLEKEIPALTSILDLVLKWLFSISPTTETNSAKLLFLKMLFNSLTQIKYQLFDYEASLIIHFLVECSGMTNQEIKENAQELIKVVGLLYSPNKVLSLLIKLLESKQIKTKIQSIVLTEEMLRKYSGEIITDSEIKAIGKSIPKENDITIPASFMQICFDCLQLIYQYKGESIWKSLDDISPVICGQLRKRFEQSAAVKKPASPNAKTIPTKESKILSSPNSSPKQKANIKDLKGQTIEYCINMLQTKDILKRADSLIILHDKLTGTSQQNKNEIIQNVSNLLCILTEIQKEIFTIENSKLPAKFALQLLAELNLICSSKDYLQKVSSKSMFIVMEQVLIDLLHNGLEKIGEQNEGEMTQKSLNSTMLMLLKNCDPTLAFCTLIQLFNKHKQSNSINKLPELIVKCILKLTKTIPDIFPTIDVGALLISIHENLLSEKTQTEPNEIATKIAKTIVSELVKVKKESIWDSYKKLGGNPVEDILIKRWIAIILKTLNPKQTNNDIQSSQQIKGKNIEENKNSGGNYRKLSSEKSRSFDFALTPTLQHSSASTGPNCGNSTVSVKKINLYGKQFL